MQSEQSKSKKSKKKLEIETSGSKIGFEKTIAELEKDGCKDEDILGLLRSFEKNNKKIDQAYNKCAVTEAEMVADGGEAGRKDIGQAAEADKKYLKLADLMKFTKKVEDLVDTELGTLQSYILQNTSARKQYLDLQQFKEHVHNWSVGVWRDRMPADQKIMPSDEQSARAGSQKEKSTKSSKSPDKKKSKKSPGGDENAQQPPSNKTDGQTAQKSKFELPTDEDSGTLAAQGEGKILVDDQMTHVTSPKASIASPSKPPRAVKVHTLTEEQKSKMYTNRLLLFKFEMYRPEVDLMLERYFQNKMFQNIDCKKHFEEVIEAFQNITKVALCNKSDKKRQASRKTDPGSVKQLKEFFLTAFKDKHGQAYFYKYEFYDGLKKFFQDQDKIFKSTKGPLGDIVILVDKSDDFERYLKDGMAPQRQTSPMNAEGTNEDPMMDDLMQNLLTNVSNCEKLLASGQVKDFARRESIQLMINQFNTQIAELERSKLTQQESLFKKQYGGSPRELRAKGVSSLTRSQDGAMTAASGAYPAFKPTRKTLKKAEPKKLTKEDYIENSLKEVFDFYARQHIQHNQGFEEMNEGMKKIDLGEFNGFLTDFKLKLPRQKTNDLFLKAGVNQKEIELGHFRKAIILVGTEYANAKLRENKERLKEWNKLIEDLKIPESYPNTAGTEESKKKLLETLNVKTDRFVKYVDNNLKQKLMMADQMPVARGKMVLKKKQTTIVGTKLRLSVASTDEDGQPAAEAGKDDEKAEQPDQPEGEKKPATDAAAANAGQDQKKEEQAPAAGESAKKGDEPAAGDGSPKKTVNFKDKKPVMDPYLIKLDKIDDWKPPRNERKIAARKEIKQLKEEIAAYEEKVRVREAENEKKAEEKEQRRQEKREEKERNKQEAKEERLEQRRADRAERKRLEKEQKEKEKAEKGEDDEDKENEEDEEPTNEEPTNEEPDDEEDEEEEDDEELDDDEEEETSDNEDALIEDDLNEERKMKLEELEEEVEKPDEQVRHPCHIIPEQIQKEIDYLDGVVKEERYEQYSLEEVCNFHIKDAYRKKIKGFHLAFNVKEKLDESTKSKYQYMVQGTAEELRLAALDRKNQRLYRKQIIEQEKEEKYKKDRQKLRLMEEQLRKKKQEELMKIGAQVQGENHAASIKTLIGDVNTTPIAYLSDPKNYQAIREKQALIERQKAIEQRKQRMALQGQHHKEVEKFSQQDIREKEIEDIITKPGFSFDDLEKLDYSEINAISNKYGEEGFNPKDMLDFNEDASDGSDEDEILRRFRNKSKIGAGKNQDISHLSDHGNIDTSKSPGHFDNKKFSKPSNYSYKDSDASNMIYGRLYDRSSQDLGQMQRAGRNMALAAATDNPNSKIGQTSGQQPYASPMYSPLQQHNPKRKIADMPTTKVRANHDLGHHKRLVTDNSSMQLMNIPKAQGPSSLHNRQSSSMPKHHQQFQSQRELPKNTPDGLQKAKKPLSYRGGYPSNRDLNASPSKQQFSEKYSKEPGNAFTPQKKRSLVQRQGSAEPQNYLALPSPFENSAGNNQLAPNAGQVAGHKRSFKGSHPISGYNAPMLGQNTIKNMKYNNTEDLNSQYSFVSAGQQPNSPHGQVSHLKNQNLLRAQQLQQQQNSQNQKSKRQMDGYMKQHEKNIQKGMKVAHK